MKLFISYRKIRTLFCGLFLFTASFAQAQEVQEEKTPTPVEKLEQRTESLENTMKVLQRFKISGYIQAQYQWGQEAASLKVGGPNENLEESFNRIGIRRGRIKLSYEDKIASGVFQLDITEKGIGIKDAYLSIKDPWIGSSSLKAGVFDRPFGFEIGYSSSRRESPERSTVFQTLFPEERDLGAALTLQAPKTSPWSILKLEAGLFAGNGIKLETDNHRDFIGHLSVNKDFGSDMSIGGGVSYYNGGVYQGTNKVYTMEGREFVLTDTTNSLGKFAKREYFGPDAQFKIISIIGMTQLRGEFLLGQQPGAKSNSKSPNSSSLLTTDTYIRNFQGGYFMLVQDLGKLPLSAVVKYDWYDPNTEVSGNEVGENSKTFAGDIAYNTWGVGLLWRATNSIRLQAYYEFNSNETSANLTGYEKNRKDDVFTLRLQYKF